MMPHPSWSSFLCVDKRTPSGSFSHALVLPGFAVEYTIHLVPIPLSPVANSSSSVSYPQYLHRMPFVPTNATVNLLFTQNLLTQRVTAVRAIKPLGKPFYIYVRQYNSAFVTKTLARRQLHYFLMHTISHQKYPIIGILTRLKRRRDGR